MSNKKLYYNIIFGMLILLSLNFVSALISCNPEILSVNSTIGGSITPSSITCSNSGSSVVSCWINSNIFTIANSPVVINSSSSSTFSISYATQNVGSFSESLRCSENGSLVFPMNIHLDVTQIQQPSNTCNLNPSLVWNVPQVVQLGTKFDTSLITFDPVNCPGDLALTYSNVHISGGITTMAGQKPIALKSVTSNGITLSINTEDLSTITYSSSLDINVFGKIFQYPFNILVTSGTSGNINFDCSQVPTCSVTNSVMQNNNSNSLVCVKVSSNLKVIPVVDNNYIIGTNVDTLSTSYTWYFKGIKNGISKVKASFTYMDSPVCSPFSQDVSIQSSGIITGGNTLKLLFTPDLSIAKPNEPLIVQVSESGSNSLIQNAQLMVDALDINSSDDYTFHYSMIANRNYTFRVIVPGYPNLVSVLSLNTNPISINITPTSGDSDTQFVINTAPGNTSLFLDGNKISNPFYSTISPGTHELRAILEGYTDGVLNITITPAVFLTPSGEFKKGVLQVFTLNKNSSCQVNYMSSATSPSEILIPEQINIDKLQFTPSKTGTYTITCNGVQKYSQTISGFNWSFKIWFMAWYWWVLGLIVIVFIIMRLRKNKVNSMSVPIGG